MRRNLVVSALAAAAILLPVAVSAQRNVATEGRGGERRSDGPDRRDWLQRAERTAEGGIRIGNPNARLKLVEYFSPTCPHCATFALEAGPTLFRDYVRRGDVSLEYRNYVLNSYDVAATLISRCAEPRAYFDLTHDLLGSQRQWVSRAQSLTEADRAQLSQLPPLEALQRLATTLGLQAMASKHGVSAAEARACFADQAGLEQINQLLQGGNALGVRGTPTFFLNGKRLDVNSWAQIEPLLKG